MLAVVEHHHRLRPGGASRLVAVQMDCKTTDIAGLVVDCYMKAGNRMAGSKAGKKNKEVEGADSRDTRPRTTNVDCCSIHRNRSVAEDTAGAVDAEAVPDD